MADKAAEVMAEAKQAFTQYRAGLNHAAVDEGTFVAGFMAGYLMGFAQGLEDDPLGRVVGRMVSHKVEAVAVAHESRQYLLSVKPA
jgi:hypothetical protein